jgi:hypothetical protein
MVEKRGAPSAKKWVLVYENTRLYNQDHKPVILYIRYNAAILIFKEFI